MRKQNVTPCMCRQCGCQFYIDPVRRAPLDLDLDCPYGCDTNGKDTQDTDMDYDSVI